MSDWGGGNLTVNNMCFGSNPIELGTGIQFMVGSLEVEVARLSYVDPIKQKLRNMFPWLIIPNQSRYVFVLHM